MTEVPLAESEGDQICTAHLHFVLFLNLFLGISIALGCCLDCRQKCIYVPGANANNAKSGQHHQVPNRGSVLENAHGTEMKAVIAKPDQEKGFTPVADNS